MPQARLVGINHVALEVGDIDEALAFYGRLFELTLRGRAHGMAFIDMGDQFLALSRGRTQPRRRAPPLRARRRRQGRDAACARGCGSRDPAGPWSRLSRSVGEPHPDRAVRRGAVHEDAGGVAEPRLSSSGRPSAPARSSAPRASIRTADRRRAVTVRQLRCARPRAACGGELRASGAPARPGSAGS